MNLKTWFKGLGVFVVSSFITSLAAANLSPSTFNFSKQGLLKLAALAGIIGVKAVVLYLKQSPLPGSNMAADWTKVGGAIALAVALPATSVMSGCVSTWEQTTYTTLATGKALIDCAVAGYNHFDADIRHACAANPDDPAFDPSQFYIQQTRQAQQAIETARQAQIACVQAFEGYAVAKLAKDKTVSVADKQAAVAGYLAQLPALFNAVRALIGAKAPSGHLIIGPSDHRKPNETLEAAGQFGVRALVWGLVPRSKILQRAALRPPDEPISRSPDSAEVPLGQ